jgi:hypothetical protein
MVRPLVRTDLTRGLVRAAASAPAGPAGPALEYAFAGATSLSGATKAGPVPTYSSSSGKRQFDSSGTLVWAPENLVARSEEFDSGVWGKTNVTVAADVTTDPDGGTSADKITADASGSSTFVNVVPVGGEANTSAVYFKRDNNDWVALSNDAFFAYFNLNTGSVGSVGEGSATLTDVGGGWYLAKWSGQQNLGTLRIRLATSDGDASVSGGESVFIWGAHAYRTPNASTAYVKTDGSAYYGPRFDHDPTDNSALGLLIEGSRTNDVHDSADASQWGTVGSPTITDTGTDRGGFNVIEVASGGSSLHSALSNGFTATNGQDIAITVYVEPGTSDQIRITTRITDGSGTDENQVRGTFGSVSLAFTQDGTITDVQETDFGTITRITFIYTPGKDGTVEIGIGPNSGTSGENVFVLGCQAEQGSFPTSFIETAGSAVTRAAGRRTSSVTDGDYQTVVITARTGQGAGVLWQLDDGSENNRIRIERNASNEIRCIITDGGTEQANLNVGTVADDTDFQVGFAWAANDIAAVLDGGTVQTDGTATIPTGLTNWRGGHDTAGEEWNAWTDTEVAYSERKSDSFLQSETS